jgi:hypothetical protein
MFNDGMFNDGIFIAACEGDIRMSWLGEGSRNFMSRGCMSVWSGDEEAERGCARPSDESRTSS